MNRALSDLTPVFTPRSRWGIASSALVLILASLALSTQASVADENTPSAAENAPEGQLETVIVTATRRAQDIKEIPTSVSAVDGNTLANEHIENYDDLTRTVPGISFAAGAGPGLDNIAIRGVSSTSGSATVGIYIDDVSITVRNTFDGTVQPKMFDLQRVEVLRGPQGTLFGASSMGGTVRFITNKPDLNDTSITGSTDVSYTEHGSVNNDSYAVLNLPVVPGTFAIRLGADVSYQSGWIDHYAPTATGYGVGSDGNPVQLYQNDDTGVLIKKDVNGVLNQVARVSASYVSDFGLAVTPEVFYQHTKSGDSALYFLNDGLYNQDKHVAEPGDDQLFVPSVTLTQSLGSLELTSVTSYFRRAFERTSDGTLYNSYIFANYLLPPALQGPQPPGAPFQPPPTAAQLTATANIIGYEPSPVVYNTNTNQVSEELRIASKEPANVGVPMNWQTGIYLSDQRQGHIDDEHIANLQSDFQQIYGYSIYNSYVGSAAIPGVTYQDNLLYYAHSHYSEKQIAPFGELTFEITPELKATAGLRYVSAKAAFDFVAAGYFTIGLPSPYSESAKYSATTPKIALDYAVTPQMNLYTSVSKGFRLGGPTGPDPYNIPGGPCDQDYANLGIAGAPLTYGSDSLWSYEIGSKGRYLDNRLSVNAALYRINWSQIQQTIVLPICGFEFTTNAGDAEVLGSELEVQARITPDWSVGLSAGNTHAYITRTIVPNIVGLGEDVLNVPQVSATASTDYEIPLADERTMFVRADFPWVGRSHAYYAATTVPFHYNPSYGVLNASIGLAQKNFAEGNKTLTASLYAKNLLASKKIIQYPSVFQVEEGYTVQPLTIGLYVSLLQ